MRSTPCFRRTGYIHQPNVPEAETELIPYTYSFAKEAVDGMPLIRAMFLDYPSAYTYGPATQYQFMYGTDFLVAPHLSEHQS